jgi:heterodisulfide reductase subunit C
MKLDMASFLDEVKATPGGEHVLACIQCGSCTGSCPMAQYMEFPPRKIIAMIRAGLRDEVLASASMWHCLSCYTCTARCPRGVKPTELAHALESLASQKGYKVGGTSTPRFYRSFVDSINGNGRVFELGMMMKYYLTTNPLAALKIWRVGLQLFLHKRIPLKAARLKNAGDLGRILKKYREAGGAE